MTTGVGFAYRAWRLGLNSEYVLTLFGNSEREAIIRGWWSDPVLRKLAVKR